MEQFETLLSRHSEAAIQDILENWERHHGLRHLTPDTLEQRWMRFMRETSFAVAAPAAA